MKKNSPYQAMRKRHILALIAKEEIGLEIGASHSPVAPKREGWNVEILDHADRGALTQKYGDALNDLPIDHEIDVNNIEDVDFVWDGKSYSELTGRRNHYDWIIASHVVEHTPNLIGFLLDCEEVLKDGGVLSLAVPDKRFCFDRFRPLSGIGQVLDCHLREETRHTPGVGAECYLYAASRGGKLGWGQHHHGDYEFLYQQQGISTKISEIANGQDYEDFHRWCFTPTSFRLLLHDLRELGLVNFAERRFFDPVGGEFFITLGKGDQSRSIDRLKLMKEIEAELSFSHERTTGFRLAQLKKRIKRALRGTNGGN